MARDNDLLVSGRYIWPGEPLFIVAEVGVNRNGDMNVAGQLTDAAANAGEPGGLL